MGRRLQEMGLAEAYGRVNVERTIERSVAGRRTDDALDGGVGESVRLSQDEAGEGQPAVEGGTSQKIRRAGRLLRLAAQKRRDLRGKRDLSLRLRRLDGGGRLARAQRLGGLAALCRRAQRQNDTFHEGRLRSECRGDTVDVMRLDPGLQEIGGNRQMRRAVLNAVELEPGEPRPEHGLPKFGAQAPAAVRPAFAEGYTVIGPFHDRAHRRANV